MKRDQMKRAGQGGNPNPALTNPNTYERKVSMNIPAKNDNFNNIQIVERDGTLRVSSREVAENFGKEHFRVLRAIRNLECSPEFNAANFGLVEYLDAKGEKRTEYSMTRDGFTFLVMGFTGKEAAKWKERYIAAFNAMEARLRQAVTSEQIERSFGIVRMLAAKVTQIERSLPAIIEATASQAVAAKMAESNIFTRRGVTAKDIWDRHNLPPKLRASTNWLGNRLCEMGCMTAKADRGNGSIRLFDPDLAEACMKNGLLHKARVYASERMGQGKFKLVRGV